jgi:Zn-dependent alcohol dehydrogenase
MMSIRSRAAIYHERGRPLVVDEVDHGDPGPDDVVVRVLASGICHSFLHRFHMDGIALPHLFGHEATGVVEAVGSAVTRVGEGDTVLVTWLPGTPGDDVAPARALAHWRGVAAHTVNVYTWAQHCRVSQHYVVPVDPAVDVTTSSVVGCAVMTGAGAVINTAGVGPGQSVAVFGAGGVGLCALQAARNVGAAPIIAVDLDTAKLSLALRFGATHTVDATSGDAVAQVRALAGRGVDFAFDTIGVPDTVRQIVTATRRGVPGLRRGGTSVLVGVCLTPPVLDLQDIMGGGKAFVGCVGGDAVPDRDFPTYLEWEATGRLPLDDLVTRRYRLDQVNEALDDLAQGRISGRAIFDMTSD